MTAVLFLGLLIGMQHALEADHVAAVASMAVRQSSVRKIVRQGAIWGIGHTITLMIVAGTAVGLGIGLDVRLAGWLEFAVGLTLVGLGGHLIYRLMRDRVHFHAHRHDGAAPHFHAHSHRDDADAHAQSNHDHDHPQGFPFRVLTVGLMHGLAGSAALIILTASNAETPAHGIAYVAMFGIGSIFGMMALSAVIAMPIVFSAKRLDSTLTWVNRGLQGSIGVATMVLGAWIAYSSALEAAV